MNILETKFKNLLVLEPIIHKDNRGFFLETYNSRKLSDRIFAPFVQDNESYSTYGVLRGLHMQVGEMAQSKLVRVISGKVLDVVVDLREDSPTYAQHYSIELSGDNFKQMYIPRGFAHGYVVLSQDAVFAYKCDNFYSKEHEQGYRYDDKAFQIDWKIPDADLIISDKDKALPFLG